MNSLRKISIISFYTLKEILKSKIAYATLIMLGVLLLLSYLSFNFAIGDIKKVVLDIGLGLASLGSLLIALFMGARLLAREIEERTVYTFLSIDLKRWNYLLGRLCGLLIYLFIHVSLLTIVSLIIFFYAEGVYSSLMLWIIPSIFLESAIVLLIVLFFSMITTASLSITLTIAFYGIGHTLYGTMLYSFVSRDQLMQVIYKVSSFIVPNLTRLNIKEFVLYKESLPLEYLCINMGYGVSYFMALLLLSITLFEKKELT